MIELSRRVKQVSPSATLAMSTRSKAMISEGIDVISLSAGEPDWDPPFEAKEAAIDSIRSGSAHYTAVPGLLSFRETISEKLKSENKIDVTADHIIITTGAKYALYEALQALVNPDDEVLVIAPYWVSYVEQIKLAGGIPRIIHTSEDDGFKLDADTLKNHITARVKGIILNYPSNPAGILYNEEELRDILEICNRKDLFIIADEIYEYFTYNGTHTSIASLDKKHQTNIVTINGVSKAYAMPGWRIGYAAGDPEVIGAMKNIQSHATSNPTTIAQHVALAAMKTGHQFVDKMVEEFRERREYFVGALNSLHGFRCPQPDGAFYVFPNVQYYLGNEVGGEVPNNTMEFAEIMLKKAHVSMVPGSAFGMEGYIRLSYSNSMDRLQEAIKRINSILEK